METSELSLFRSRLYFLVLTVHCTLYIVHHLCVSRLSVKRMCTLHILLCTVVHLHSQRQSSCSLTFCAACACVCTQVLNSSALMHRHTHTNCIFFCVLRTSALTFNFIYYFYLLLLLFFLLISLSLSLIVFTSLTISTVCTEHSYSNFIWINFFISFTVHTLAHTFCLSV